MANLVSGQGTFTDYLVHRWMKEVRENCWVSLHFDSPSVSGALASEFSISTGGYHRVKVEFSEPSNRVMWNQNSLQWKGLSANKILYVGGWDKKQGGNLLWWEKLPEPHRVPEGHGWTLANEQLALSFA